MYCDNGILYVYVLCLKTMQKMHKFKQDAELRHRVPALSSMKFCTSTTSSRPLNFKVIGQRSRSYEFFCVFLCVRCCGYPRTVLSLEQGLTVLRLVSFSFSWRKMLQLCTASDRSQRTNGRGPTHSGPTLRRRVVLVSECPALSTTVHVPRQHPTAVDVNHIYPMKSQQTASSSSSSAAAAAACSFI